MTNTMDHNVEAMLQEGVRLGRNRESERALATFRRVIELRPDLPDGYFNLGVALRGMKRSEEAQAAFETTVRLRGDWAEAWFNLGNTYLDTHQPDRAVTAFNKAIECRPSYVKAINNLANLYLEQGNAVKAEQLLCHAILHKPDYAEGYYSLGRARRRLRKFREALEVTTKATSLQPDNQRYQLRLAELQRLTGDRKSCGQTLERLLEQTGAPEVAVQLATLVREQGKSEQALAILDQAVSRKQFSAELLWLRSDIRRTLNRHDDALEDVNASLELDPSMADAHNLRGVILFAKGRAEEAIEAYQRAIHLRPDLVDAHNNLGAALQAIRRTSEGLTSLNTALRLKPDFAIARLNRALHLLRNGDFVEGWREFEWRFVCPDYRLTSFPRPVWTGEPLQGKSILLRCEQGLGDTFQFIRYAPLIQARGGRVIVECQDAACEIVQSCSGVDLVVKRGAPLPKIDVQVPLMSLPLVFATTLSSIPNQTPYLAADPQLVNHWQGRLPKGGLRIGIAWQGNKKFQGDAMRSLRLENFAAIAQIPGVTLVSLQKNEGVEQLKLVSDFEVQTFTEELDVAAPFRDTAALICACDLVITSDTAIAHLAGALGKPVWVALAYAPDWRWLTSGEACPWYLTMRLFRQARFGDWKGVFAELAAEVQKLGSGDRTRLTPQAVVATAPPRIETSPGELVDKITILEIKRRRLTDPNKLAHVNAELTSLLATKASALPASPRLESLAQDLARINEQLWDIEDAIRECEQSQDFGPRFIELARSVYLTNDQRAQLKKAINQLIPSGFEEEKSYAQYRTDATKPSIV